MTKEEMKQAFEPWLRLFEKYKGFKYYITPIDRKALGDLIEMELDPKDYEPKITAYLSDARWKEFGGHKFHVFVRNINQVEIVPQKDERKIAPRLIACSDCGTPHKADELCPKCYQEVK